MVSKSETINNIYNKKIKLFTYLIVLKLYADFRYIGNNDRLCL